MAKTRRQRFWGKVEKTPTCWLWRAGQNGVGYGVFWDGTRSVCAHRWAYEDLIGPIPTGLHIDHLCRTPVCVNPAHLEPVTQATNILRGYSPMAKQARMTHCNAGHEFTPRNTRLYRNQRYCKACQAARSREYRARQ